MSVANINSESWCKRAYLNYHIYGNSMGVTDRDMGEICRKWEGKLDSWKASAGKDQTEYEIDDSQFLKAKENGKKATQDAIGYDGSKPSVANGVVDATGALAAGVGVVAGKAVGNWIAKKAIEKTAEKAAEKAVENAAKNFTGKAAKEAVKKAARGAIEKGSNNFITKGFTNMSAKAATKAAEKAGKEAGTEAVKEAASKGVAKNIGAWVTAALVVAAAIKYHASKPNKEEKEACDDLQNEMANSQMALSETQSEMDTMAGELQDLADEAEENNEENNEKLEEQKTEYDMYMDSVTEIAAKVESGQPLTEDEKALYNELIEYINENGEEINTLIEEAYEGNNEIYEDMETYQEGYDYAAKTIGEVKGVTDFAEGFDEATRTMCYVEGGAQGLNMTEGGIASARLLTHIFSPMDIAMGISAGIAAGVCGWAGKEQFQWAGEVGNEIDARKATQDLNNDTNEYYIEELDNYAASLEGVEDLELDVPDDMETLEDKGISEEAASAVPVAKDDKETEEPPKEDIDKGKDKDKDVKKTKEK